MMRSWIMTSVRGRGLGFSALRRLAFPVSSRGLSTTPGDGEVEIDPNNPPIPEYKPRTADESLEQKQARLVYQSRKRGMLENGLLLSTFASRYLKKLTPEQLDMYDNLINKPSNDWEIYYWVTGKSETPKEYNTEVMDMLKEHAKNKEKEQRYIQPDLYETHN